MHCNLKTISIFLYNSMFTTFFLGNLRLDSGSMYNLESSLDILLDFQLLETKPEVISVFQ